jgi:hypothetical protein
LKLQPDDLACTELCCQLVETCIPEGCGLGETRAPDGACVRFGKGDGFAVRMDGQLRSLLAGTYLGGSKDDWAVGVLHDRSGGLFITGTTASPDFALPAGGWQTQHNGSYDTYVLKMDGALSAPDAGTYLGCGLEPRWGRGDRYSLFSGPEGGLYVGGSLFCVGGSCRSTPGAFEARPGTGTFQARLGASFLALFSEDLKSRQAPPSSTARPGLRPTEGPAAGKGSTLPA